MRNRLCILATLLATGAITGCFDAYSDSSVFNQGNGGTGTGGNGGNGGTTMTTTTAPPECIPANTASPVEDGCGVFVSQSKGDDANGKGTKASPFKTLDTAISAAVQQKKPVYMCGETFTGPLLLQQAALVYGALDCASDWKYVGDQGRTVITAAADATPLRVRSGANMEMNDIDITAVDAVTKGGSSIAVIAEAASTLRLVRSTVTAGLGAAGVDQDPIAGTAMDGVKGVNGVDACTTAQAVTGDPPVTTCSPDNSIAGSGGVGATNGPTPGGSGDPGSDVNPNFGGAEGANNPCGNGKEGLEGAAGTSSIGAAGTGTLSPDTGYVGVTAADGLPGKPGQGGGGGGGSKGGSGANKCSDPAKTAGASGGTGGSGGCGGSGGKGGGGGGASIAIATFGATLTFDSVNLVAKDGGRGGNGGDGQKGGTGAEGGTGGALVGSLNAGCKGGFGGNGGKGGMGGGGLGGHSIGVAYTGKTAPDTTGATVKLGAFGPGGTGDGDTGKGADGVAADTLGF
ncbi:MAG: PGRS family protein [Polyangiaceae bacterium]